MFPRYGGRQPFPERLARADVAERAVAAWFEERGRCATLYSAQPPSAAGGPRLVTLDGEHVAPDLLIVRPRDGRATLIDVKERHRWTWHHRSAEWVTGFAANYLEDYGKAGVASGLPVWIGFLFHLKTSDPNAASPAPDGLFVGRLDRLVEHIHHEHDTGREVICYWPLRAFCRIASAADVAASAGRRGIRWPAP